MTKIEKLQKNLKKEFNLQNAYTDLANISRAYSYGYDFDAAFAAQVVGICKELNIIPKVIISKNAYIEYYVYRDENGMGHYGTPRRIYKEEYEEMLEEEKYEALIKYNLYKNGDKAVKKISNLITKTLGKDKAALLAFRKYINNANSPYDRNLSINDKAAKGLIALWDNKYEVYDLFTRESLKRYSNGELAKFVREVR